MVNREIPIFFTIDDSYAPFLAVALNSAIKNSDPQRNYKASYTEDKKKTDSECLELLVRRGMEIPENDITFKKMNEKGVRIRL